MRFKAILQLFSRLKPLLQVMAVKKQGFRSAINYSVIFLYFYHCRFSMERMYTLKFLIRVSIEISSTDKPDTFTDERVMYHQGLSGS